MLSGSLNANIHFFSGHNYVYALHELPEGRTNIIHVKYGRLLTPFNKPEAAMLNFTTF